MNERPLSPHLLIYRLPLTALLSITHRITGIILLAGMILLVVCLMAAAEGAGPYGSVAALLGSPMGRLFIGCWLYALFFHLCHGIRHLIWDTGHGFGRATLTRYAWLEIAMSIVLTSLIYALSLKG